MARDSSTSGPDEPPIGRLPQSLGRRRMLGLAAYSGRLAAVDVLTESHALVLIESLRVNNGLVPMHE
jgi:hypothetical protein